jgi:hypothetical protein
MPFESSSDVKFEIGHVLFIDIVGYSKLLINEQSKQMQDCGGAFREKLDLGKLHLELYRAIHELPIAPAENRFNQP